MLKPCSRTGPTLKYFLTWLVFIGSYVFYTHIFILLWLFVVMNRLPFKTLFNFTRRILLLNKVKQVEGDCGYLFCRPVLFPKWEARHDGVQPQLPSAPRDSISIDDDDDDEEAMEVDSHEHDWRIAEFAPNTTLGRQQANNSQLITAGHYILSSFDVMCTGSSFWFWLFVCTTFVRNEHDTYKKLWPMRLYEWQPIHLARLSAELFLHCESL